MSKKKITDRQIEKLREAYKIAVHVDEAQLPPIIGETMKVIPFVESSTRKMQTKIRNFALSKGMTPADYFREIEAPLMTPVQLEIMAVVEEAQDMLSLGTIPAALRATGAMDDRKATEGLVTEFSPGDYLPESTPEWMKEATRNVAPSRFLGGLVGGVGAAKGAQMLMNKAFGMSTGLTSATKEAAKAGVKLPAAGTSATEKAMQFASNPRVVQSMEMGMGFGAMEVPAQLIRSGLAGEDITADKVMEAMAIGIATGLAFDMFIAMVPKALRASRKQIMEMRQAYRSRDVRKRGIELKPEIDRLVEEANKRGMNPQDYQGPAIQHQIDQTSGNLDAPIQEHTGVVETGDGVYRQEQPPGIDDTMRRRAIKNESAEEIKSMEAELDADLRQYDGQDRKVVHIRDNVPIENLGQGAEFADDLGEVFVVTRSSNRPGRPVLARSTEDGLIYEMEPQEVLTVRTLRDRITPEKSVEASGIPPEDALMGIPEGPEGTSSSGRTTVGPVKSIDAPESTVIAPDPKPTVVPSVDDGIDTRPQTVAESVHLLEGQMKSGLGEETLGRIEDNVKAIIGERRLRAFKKQIDEVWRENPDDPVANMYRARIESEIAKYDAQKAQSNAHDQFADDVVDPMGKAPTEESAAAEVARQEAEAAKPAGDPPSPAVLDALDNSDVRLARDARLAELKAETEVQAQKWDEYWHGKDSYAELEKRGDEAGIAKWRAREMDVRAERQAVYDEIRAVKAETPYTTDEVLDQLAKIEVADDAREWFSDYGARVYQIVDEAGLDPHSLEVKGFDVGSSRKRQEISMSSRLWFNEKGGAVKSSFDNFVKQVTKADAEKGAEMRRLVDAYIDFHTGDWSKMKYGQFVRRPKNLAEKAKDDAALRDKGEKPKPVAREGSRSEYEAESSGGNTPEAAESVFEQVAAELDNFENEAAILIDEGTSGRSRKGKELNQKQMDEAIEASQSIDQQMEDLVATVEQEYGKEGVDRLAEVLGWDPRVPREFEGGGSLPTNGSEPRPIYHANGSPIVVGDRIEYGGERLNVEFIDLEKRLISGTNRGKPVSVVVDAKHHPTKLGKASKKKPPAEPNKFSLRGFILAYGGIDVDAITNPTGARMKYRHSIDMNVVANTGPKKIFRKAGTGGKTLDQIAELLNEVDVDEADAEILAMIASIRKQSGNADGPLTGDDIGPLLARKEIMDVDHGNAVEDAISEGDRRAAEQMGIDPDNPNALDDDFNVAKFVDELGDSPYDAEPGSDLAQLVNFRNAGIDALKKGESITGTKLTPEMRGKLVEQIADADHEIKQMQILRGKPSAKGNNAGRPAAGAQQALQGTAMDPAEIARRADQAASSQQGLFGGDDAQRIKDLNDDIITMKNRLKEMEDSSVDPFSDEADGLRREIKQAEDEITGLQGGDPPIGGAADFPGQRRGPRGPEHNNRLIHARENNIFGGDKEAARLYREQVTGKNNPMDMTGEEQQTYIAHLRHKERIRTEAVARDQDLTLNELHEAGARDPDDLLGDLGGREQAGLPEEFAQEMRPESIVMQTPTSKSNLSGTFLGSLLVRGGDVPKHLRKFFTDKMGVVHHRFNGGAETMRLMFKELGDRTTELHAIAEEAQMSVAEGRKVMMALDGQIEVQALGDPRLIKVHNASRQILDDLADRLELAPDQRISEYAPHIFKGRLGELIAQELAGETGMNVAAQAVNFDWRGRPTTVPRVPQAKFFQHLMKRKGAEGYEMDWATVMQSYTRGATRKIYIDQFLKEARVLIGQTPMHGKGSTVREEMSSYAYFMAGGTTKTKQRQAHFLADSEAFNGGVDRMMALLAPGTYAKNLGMIYDNPEQMLDWYRKVVEMSHLPEGAESGAERVTRARAAAAIAIDDLRAQLSNPNAGPVVLSQLQRIMAWHKLGGNIAHFVTNSTQFLVNSVPELGAQAAGRGAKMFLGHISRQASARGNWRLVNQFLGGQKDQVIKVGKVSTAVSDLLAEIRHDVPSHSEFLTPSRFGRKFAATEDIVFKPSQWSEYWNRGATVLGKYEDALRKMDDLPNTDPIEAHRQALEQAVQAEQKTQFIFNRSGTPRFLRSPLARTMFMFQSYTMHQINFSWDILRDATVNPTKENLSKLALHFGSYAALLGPGMMAGYETSDRYSHPMVDKYDQLMGKERRGSEPPLLNFFGGVWAGAIWQAKEWVVGNQDTGQYVKRGLAPAAVSRMIPREGEGPIDYTIRNVTGLRPTREAKKKDPRRRRRRRRSLRGRAD